MDCLPDNYEVTRADLEAAAERESVHVEPGDVVCVRVGRMGRWPDYDAYVLQSPGIGLEAAKYLCEECGAMCIGGDNDSLECDSPSKAVLMPVHSYMFATAGAQIIESLWLEDLADQKVYEFAFIGLPLRIVGATGSPMRTIAFALK